MTKEHEALRELLGAYVLGQLDPPTRAAVSAHLPSCAGCRAEVAELGPVVAALQRLDPTVPPDVNPPEHLVDQVIEHIHQRQRFAARRARWRRAGAGVLVAASLTGAFGLGSWFTGTRGGPPVIDVPLKVAAAGVSADAGLVRHTWGTELKLEATGLTEGASYTVQFVGDDGARVGAGSFLGTGAKPVVCSVNAAIALDAASELRITDAAGALVLDADLK
jgi:predicted anti-sigma-YlaC factor YlaD